MSKLSILRDELQDLGFIRKLQNGYSKKIFAEYIEKTISNIFKLELPNITNQTFRVKNSKTEFGKYIYYENFNWIKDKIIF